MWWIVPVVLGLWYGTPVRGARFVPSVPPNPTAPPAHQNDTAARGLRYMAGLMRNDPNYPVVRKLTRDGMGSREAGGIYNNIQDLLPLILALQALSAPAPPAPPADAPPPDPAAGPAPPPPPAPPAAPPAVDPLTLQLLLQLVGGAGRGGGRYSGDDPNELAVGYDDTNRGCVEVKPGTICDPDTDIRNLLWFPEYVLAVGDRKAFRIAFDGTPIDAVGQSLTEAFQSLNGTPTATLRFGPLYCVFYGENITLFDNTSRPIGGVTPIKEVFFGVKRPVRGAFMFNEHTLALFFDRQFVFYQPLANPPVDPRFSPQPNNIVPGGPETIDGAFQMGEKRYLYRDEWLYEISSDEMQVSQKMPLRKRLDSGWINCKKHSRCK